MPPDESDSPAAERRLGLLPYKGTRARDSVGSRGPSGGAAMFHGRPDRNRPCTVLERPYAENELPQPQPPVEFGFLNVKPEPCIDET